MQNKYDDTEEIIINQDSIEYKEKTADEMFEELGYYKDFDETKHEYRKENSVITLKNFIEIFNERKTKGDIATIDVLGEEIYALEHILSEREQDKKRINELEEEIKNEIKARDILVKLNEDSIPKQKVKDILQNNRNELFSITYVEPIQYKPFEMQIERINKIEKEILEEK